MATIAYISRTRTSSTLIKIIERRVGGTQQDNGFLLQLEEGRDGTGRKIHPFVATSAFSFTKSTEGVIDVHGAIPGGYIWNHTYFFDMCIIILLNWKSWQSLQCSNPFIPVSERFCKNCQYKVEDAKRFILDVLFFIYNNIRERYTI